MTRCSSFRPSSHLSNALGPFVSIEEWFCRSSVGPEDFQDREKPERADLPLIQECDTGVAVGAEAEGENTAQLGEDSTPVQDRSNIHDWYAQGALDVRGVRG